jgi:hypothetical protein
MTVMSRKSLGSEEVEKNVWLALFIKYELGYIDTESKSLQPSENPYGPIKVEPMCPV